MAGDGFPVMVDRCRCGWSSRRGKLLIEIDCAGAVYVEGGVVLATSAEGDTDFDAVAGGGDAVGESGGALGVDVEEEGEIVD
jgi:hypothetical protein